jgi:pimeloyl-ACP methyl ester carboxylesterase
MKASLRLLVGSLSGLSFVAPGIPARFYAKKFVTPMRRPRPESEKKILARAGESGSFEGNAYWAWGSGPTVLLVHGWQGRGAQLAAFVEPLVAAGHRVVCWDAPAHGESPESYATVVAIGFALSRFARSQGNLHAIVAHSLGGLAASIAIQEGIQVSKLVLVASPSSMQRIFDRFTKLTRLSKRAARAFQNNVEIFAGRRVDQIDVHQLREISLLPQVLLIHSADDQDVPYAEVFGWQAIFPEAQVSEQKDLGHRRILKDPQVVREALAFLTA